jgi:hypothetical protein
MKIIDLVTKISCLFFLILVNQAIFGQQYTINTVPNPKKLNNTWVSDPDNILYPDTKRLLNDKIIAIEKNNGVEITIVALNSIGKVNPADFAVDLFNYWKVGKADKNNGRLILLVMDQRRVEFKTGYGLEEILTDKEKIDTTNWNFYTANKDDMNNFINSLKVDLKTCNNQLVLADRKDIIVNYYEVKKSEDVNSLMKHATILLPAKEDRRKIKFKREKDIYQ